MKMLVLTGPSGNNRDVFAHPEDPDLLIKTVKPEALAKRSGPQAHWSKHLFRRYKHYLTFLRECQEHIVSHLDGDRVPDFVQTVIGFVETDRGLGLVTRAERDRAGAYAKTLAQLIAAGHYDDEARQALEKFKQSFLSSSVIVTDLNVKNLVYSYSAECGAHFVVVDGYGEKNIIPLNSSFRWCNLRSKRKRVKRIEFLVERAIRLHHDAHCSG
ncbi:MAG: YrbL family protein [Verrucomicrobia bacterium]|nr:YrbL family protein [Verrucomicrobiota bacterium]